MLVMNFFSIPISHYKLPFLPTIQPEHLSTFATLRSRSRLCTRSCSCSPGTPASTARHPGARCPGRRPGRHRQVTPCTGRQYLPPATTTAHCLYGRHRPYHCLQLLTLDCSQKQKAQQQEGEQQSSNSARCTWETLFIKSAVLA